MWANKLQKQKKEQERTQNEEEKIQMKCCIKSQAFPAYIYFNKKMTKRMQNRLLLPTSLHRQNN